MESLKNYLDEKRKMVDQWLDKLVPSKQTPPSEIHEAMRYSLFAGGKRLRPVLVIAAAEPFEVPEPVLYPIASAFEMIHTYSLIHDDLPAMDNDDMRRGLPTCHKVFGDAMAILAGDALLTRAFEVIATLRVPSEYVQRKAEVIAELATAAGTVNGLIGGQVVDILSEGKEVSPETLDYIHNAKTGAMIRASVCTGAIIGGAEPHDFELFTRYGEAAGLAFQITDDILDVLATSEQLGKTAGKDANVNKVTYVSMHGIEKSKQKALELAEIAIGSAQSLSLPSPALEAIAKFFIERAS
ncbi:MAG: polyprenyl synthetase family protein [Blastocatellia bacterium]|nr:polyprenyl synthetase family protein [Blastocatellia bacterium]